MYSLDPNAFMNWMLGLVLATGALLLCITVICYAVRGRNSRGMSNLYMLSGLFICFGLVVAVLGFRGRTSGSRPWHFLLDMKYQPKYTAQGQGAFFSDGRAMRMPVENAIPFDGTDYSADAGYHPAPRAAFLKADIRYYRGIANLAATELKEGIQLPKDAVWTGGQIAEGYFAARIPDRAVREEGGWARLLERGRAQFGVHCAACHGTCGRGGVGIDAYGIVGAYGISVAPADVSAVSFHSQPDGQLFNTIAHGKGSMPAYGHQVPAQDRWAIVAYLRVLQFGRIGSTPVAK